MRSTLCVPFMPRIGNSNLKITIAGSSGCPRLIYQGCFSPRLQYLSVNVNVISFVLLYTPQPFLFFFLVHFSLLLVNCLMCNKVVVVVVVVVVV